MDWSMIAALSALVLALYLVVTDWVNLAPWNNVEDLPVGQKLLISLANYTPLLFIAFACVQQNAVLVSIAMIIGTVDLLMHIAYWWLPYFRGASDKQREEHARLFAGTTTFLPPIGNHPIPNAQHVVVGIVMSLMVAATLITTIRSFVLGGVA